MVMPCKLVIKHVHRNFQDGEDDYGSWTSESKYIDIEPREFESIEQADKYLMELEGNMDVEYGFDIVAFTDKNNLELPLEWLSDARKEKYPEIYK